MPGGITTPRLKLYNMAVMRKIAKYWHKNSKNRQIDQWNERENSEISQQSFSHLNFDKGTKKSRSRKKKTAYSTNGADKLAIDV